MIETNDRRVTLVTRDRLFAEFEVTTHLDNGSHILTVTAVDSLGLKGQDRVSFSIKEKEFRFENVLNYPNPMSQNTFFTYELSQPANVVIKIYTIAGRLIHVIEDYSMKPFNAIEWDGYDRDGDRVANGVYFYKIVANNGNVSREFIGRLAKVE